jgi:hypothetical protein
LLEPKIIVRAKNKCFPFWPSFSPLWRVVVRKLRLKELLMEHDGGSFKNGNVGLKNCSYIKHAVPFKKGEKRQSYLHRLKKTLVRAKKKCFHFWPSFSPLWRVGENWDSKNFWWNTMEVVSKMEMLAWKIRVIKSMLFHSKKDKRRHSYLYRFKTKKTIVREMFSLLTLI